MFGFILEDKQRGLAIQRGDNKVTLSGVNNKEDVRILQKDILYYQNIYHQNISVI